jgi:hypothetical protein
VKHVTPYFMVQSVRTNVLSHSANFMICSDGNSRRLFLNVFSFVYAEFMFVTNAMYFSMFFSCVCVSIYIYKYIKIFTLYYCTQIFLKT